VPLASVIVAGTDGAASAAVSAAARPVAVVTVCAVRMLAVANKIARVLEIEPIKFIGTTGVMELEAVQKLLPVKGQNLTSSALTRDRSMPFLWEGVYG
jgi:hypothetical protein